MVATASPLWAHGLYTCTVKAIKLYLLLNLGEHVYYLDKKIVNVCNNKINGVNHRKLYYSKHL